jgi:hypothetical protein
VICSWTKLIESACPLVVPFITCGRHNDYNYMVMELLGENISELRRRQVNGFLRLATAARIIFVPSLQKIYIVIFFL